MAAPRRTWSAPLTAAAPLQRARNAGEDEPILDFTEFFVGMWNYCTMDRDSLVKVGARACFAPRLTARMTQSAVALLGSLPSTSWMGTRVGRSPPTSCDSSSRSFTARQSWTPRPTRCGRARARRLMRVGYLCGSSCGSVLRRHGRRAQIMRTLDRNGDGKVSFDEFRKMERRAQSLLFPVLSAALPRVSRFPPLSPLALPLRPRLSNLQRQLSKTICGCARAYSRCFPRALTAGVRLQAQVLGAGSQAAQEERSRSGSPGHAPQPY